MEKRDGGKKVLADNYVSKGSRAQAAMIQDIRKEIAQMNINAADYLAKGLEWADKKEKQSKGVETSVDVMNKVYSRELMTQCSQLVLRGRNADAVLQAVGVFTAGYLVNKDFRDSVNQTVGKTLMPAVNRISESAPSNSRWKKWCDKVNEAANGGRLPLNAKTAAMMQVGFDKKLYDAIREPGADVNALYESYDKSCKDLYKIAAADGVSVESIHRNFRNIVGQMITVDPEYARVYRDTAYHEVKKERGKLSAEGDRYLWFGEYLKDGKAYDGVFKVRKPMDNELINKMVNTDLEDAMGRCNTLEDLQQFANAFRHGIVPDDPKHWIHGWLERTDFNVHMCMDDTGLDRGAADARMSDLYAENIKTHLETWCQQHPSEFKKACDGFQERKQASQTKADEPHNARTVELPATLAKYASHNGRDNDGVIYD